MGVRRTASSRHVAALGSAVILQMSQKVSSIGFAATPPPSVHGSLNRREPRTADVGGRAEFQLVCQNSYALRSSSDKTLATEHGGAAASRQWPGGVCQDVLRRADWLHSSCIWSRL